MSNLAATVLRYLYTSNVSPIHMHGLVAQVHSRLNLPKPEPETYSTGRIKAAIQFLVFNKILSEFKGLVGLTGPQRSNVEQWILVSDILAKAIEPVDKTDNEGVDSAGSKGDLQSAS